jgi:hypothetical protein
MIAVEQNFLGAGIHSKAQTEWSVLFVESRRVQGHVHVQNYVRCSRITGQSYLFQRRNEVQPDEVTACDV